VNIFGSQRWWLSDVDPVAAKPRLALEGQAIVGGRVAYQRTPAADVLSAEICAKPRVMAIGEPHRES